MSSSPESPCCCSSGRCEHCDDWKPNSLVRHGRGGKKKKAGWRPCRPARATAKGTWKKKKKKETKLRLEPGIPTILFSPEPRHLPPAGFGHPLYKYVAHGTARQSSKRPRSTHAPRDTASHAVVVVSPLLPPRLSRRGGEPLLAKSTLPAGAGHHCTSHTNHGDSAPDDCATYLQSAVLDVNGHCNSNRRAAILLPQLRRHQRVHRLRGRLPAGALYNYPNVSDKAAFERTYYALMGRLAARAVNGSSEAVFGRRAPDGTMYGLVQCMRDRTAAECGPLPAGVGCRSSCCYVVTL
ncbi:hypothetical protein ACP70R_000273 [Stipagrostis hirtigluma subsp. patula]